MKAVFGKVSGWLQSSLARIHLLASALFRPVVALLSKLKSPARALIALWLMLTGAVVLVNLHMIGSSKPFVFREADRLPENDVGLVLGTTPRLAGGATNPHFQRRIEAAASLYHAGKVKHLLLSGDNHLREYNEPVAMKSALMAAGVPESAMTLDYAGLRTLDSIVRAREVFGQERLTIITDEFHAYRAVFLSRHYGIDAVAYCSASVPFGISARSRMREYGARVKAALDLYILHTKPRFLGEKIDIKV